MSAASPEARDILEAALALLKGSLPPGWDVQRQAGDQADDLADAVIQIGSRQATARVVVEVKSTLAPKDVDPIVRQARLIARVAGATPMLVVAPWLSPRTRAQLELGGVNYIDLTGTVRFVSEYPPIYIDRESQVRGPVRRPSNPSLKGPNAGRVVRLLADVKPPYGVRELAARATVSPGYVSRVLDQLETEGLVDRDSRGRVAAVEWRQLLLRRSETYRVFETNRSAKYVAPNGPGFAYEVANDLPTGPNRLWVTGSFPVERIVGIAPPTLLVLYATGGIDDFAAAAGLLPTDAGANVVVLTPYDSVVVTERWPSVPPPSWRIPVVAASQLVLDSLTGVGRMPQEAEALMDWMQANESKWRLSSLADLDSPPSS